jgi:hypothetical protein
MRPLRFLALVALVLATTARAQAPAASAPAPLAPLRVIAFAGGWNLPLWAAQRKGFFEQQGLAVQLSYTPGSGALVDGLMKGRHDIARAAIDNLVAYQEGQGADAARGSRQVGMGVDPAFSASSGRDRCARWPTWRHAVGRRDDYRLRIRPARAPRPRRAG